MCEHKLSEIQQRINTDKFYSWSVWRNTRAEVIDRDNKACKVCGKPNSIVRLYVHHKKELKDFPSLALDKENLITLCGRCHNDIHEKEEELKRANTKKKKFINEERW